MTKRLITALTLAAVLGTAEAGVTKEQMKALRAGGWEDDHFVFRTPAWMRSLGKWEDAVREQLIYLWTDGWRADSDRYGDGNIAEFDVLDEALEQCDRWKDDIEPKAGQMVRRPVHPPTNQAARFQLFNEKNAPAWEAAETA